MSTGSGSAGLSRVERRCIEIQAVAPVIRAVAERVGREEAMAMLREANEREAFARGSARAREKGPGCIDELEAEVASWGAGGVWEMEILERTATTYFFDVRRCPYHERYRELGLLEFGVAMSCCRDAPHARGFNPRLELVRTKTLMEGDDRCDFRYHLEAKE